MLKAMTADTLSAHPTLSHTMFTDRRLQFRDRLGWPVTITENGEERDQYDPCNPLYLIWEGAGGKHGASLRLMPTTGPTMINDFFSDLAGGAMRDPAMWECTRFCLAPGAEGWLAAALLLGAAEFGLAQGLTSCAGVFDQRMVRVYARLGWAPEVLGQDPDQGIAAGLWHFTPAAADRMAQKSGLTRSIMQQWLMVSLPHLGDPEPRAA